MYDKFEVNITENGVYHFVPSGRPVDEINITVDVESSKPEESLIETITTNGSYSYTPEEGSVFSAVSIAVDVHPTDKLVETIITNGMTSFSGEWKDAAITIAVPSDQKPEESLEKTITSNGDFHYEPTPGSVFSSVDITVAIQTTTTVTMTQAEYDALTVKDPNTIYLING